MEGALRAEEVVGIAVDYAHPPFDMLGRGVSRDQSKEKDKEAKSVSDTAVSVLDHVAKAGGGANALRAFSMSNTMPDREIAWCSWWPNPCVGKSISDRRFRLVYVSKIY
jgi:hypothetical protein